MSEEDRKIVVEWLDSVLPKVSQADTGLLKELLLEFLEEHPLDQGRDVFIEAVCALVDGIIVDSKPFAEQFYDTVVAQGDPLEDVAHWVTIYDLPGYLCRQKLIIREFEQFGEICASKLCGSVSQDRRNALIKYKDRTSVEACLRSTVPFFNDRFVQVDTVGHEEPDELRAGTPIGQLSTQLNVKSKQLAGYRERLREIQERIEATNPKDSCNVRHCNSLYREFVEELERKQLTPSLLHHLRDRLQALREDPKMYVKPKTVAPTKRVKT